MIVFIGDWVKLSGKWRQVVSVNTYMDMFAPLDSDGEYQWFGTEAPEFFDSHVSDTEMQDKLQENGL